MTEPERLGETGAADWRRVATADESAGLRPAPIGTAQRKPLGTRIGPELPHSR